MRTSGQAERSARVPGVAAPAALTERSLAADRRTPRPPGRHDVKTTQQSGVAATAKRVLSALVEGQLSRLPVTVRFWDGSELEATPPRPGGLAASGSAPVVVAGDRRALSHLLYNPGQLGFARAWVDGSLSVEGD